MANSTLVQGRTHCGQGLLRGAFGHYTAAMTDPAPQGEFEISRKAAKRAQWTLNALVILSAIAASVFFIYVLHNLKPFGQRQPPDVNVPTSAILPTVAMLRTDKDATLALELRDVDEASGYRDSLSESMRTSLAITQPGRLYRLRVANAGKEAIEIKAPGLGIRDTKGSDWTVRWLAEVASAENATAAGRMMLAQGAHEFTLQPGESRQLNVFVPGSAPPAEDFHSAEFRTQGGLRVAMNRQEVKVATP